MLLYLCGNLPTFIHISDGKMHNVIVLDKLIFEPLAIYLMDKGYLDFNRLYRMNRFGAFFLTRAAMEEASVIMVGLSPERILQGLTQVQRQKIGENRNFRNVADYSMPNVSEKMVRIILSYTSYVKRVVWSQDV